jgi:hypothetical protein
MRVPARSRLFAVWALVGLAACDGGTTGGTPPAPTGTTAPPATAAVTTRPAATPASTQATTAAPADQTAKVDKALPLIRKLAADDAIKKAIKAQNAKKTSLDDIKNLDAEWQKATGVIDKMKPYLDNDCVKAIKKHAAELPAIVEAFAMDDQGALVGTMNKTSDFWQGDEDKWTKSFAGGKGAEFVDKPKFDESSQTYSVQVSVPVLDDDKAIGAVTVGLSLDKL